MKIQTWFATAKTPSSDAFRLTTRAAGGFGSKFYVYIRKNKLCELVGATVETNQIRKSKRNKNQNGRVDRE